MWKTAARDRHRSRINREFRAVCTTMVRTTHAVRISRPAQPAHYIMTDVMHIVIADPLPASAVDSSRSVPGWTVDAAADARPSELARDLADADALDRSQRDARSTRADRGGAEASGDRPRRHRRRQRRRRRRHRARHPRHERARRQQHQRRRARDGADARARARRSRRRRVDEARRVGQEEAHGRRAARQDARPRRPRADRTGSRRTRARSFGMDLVAHDPFISEQRGRQRLASSCSSLDESVRARRLHHAAPAGAAGDAPSVQRRAARAAARRVSES